MDSRLGNLTEASPGPALASLPHVFKEGLAQA